MMKKWQQTFRKNLIKNRSKGQLSIDFMLTIIAVLIFVQLFLTFSNTYLESATELNIRQQEKLIILQLAAIINETETINDAKVTIDYRIPWIYEGAKPAGQDCNISFLIQNFPDENQIKIDYIKNETELITEIQTITLIPDTELLYESQLLFGGTDKNFFCGGRLRYEKN
jgi:hypothetical protein